MKLNGGAIRDIPTFYAEINRVFMTGENWRLAESLDALSDMLHGGFGAIKGKEPVRIIWHDIEASRSALGVAATCAFLTEKLERPGLFDKKLIGEQLAALEHGTGQTYFEIVLEIISEHRNIDLVMA